MKKNFDFDYGFPWPEAEFLNGRRVVITGGAGFIGSNLAYIMVNHGAKVVVLDDLSSGFLSNLDDVKKSVKFIKGDIRDLETCKNAFKKADYVVHLAACASVPKSVDQPVFAHEANATGSLNVMLAARDNKVSRVVCASSCALYGDGPENPKTEELRPAPLSPYATQKLFMEGYAKNFADIFGLQVACLRFFNVFGPRQDPNSDYAAVIPKFITLLAEGKRPKIFGDGLQTRDFVFVADVAQALIRALAAQKSPGGVYNVGSGKEISVLDLFNEIRKTLKLKTEPVFEPPRAGDVRNSRADISKIKRELGFKPRFTFRRGLERTVEWFKP